MIDWPIDSDMENNMNDAWAVDERQPQVLQYTPKLAIVRRQKLLLCIRRIHIDITTLAPTIWHRV